MPHLKASLTDTPVIMLNGARQTGKSTLMKSLVSEHKAAEYASLDDITILTSAKNDPYHFLAQLKAPAIIDEIPHAPELFLTIKLIVDENRTPGRFLLTGSANVLLLPKMADSLAGRMEILTLHPLSVGELIGQSKGLIETLVRQEALDSLAGKQRFSRQDLMDKAFLGGYPEIQTRPSRSRQLAWFQAYINTILQRDVRDLASIEKLTDLPHLLSLLATRSSSLLNFSELARSVGLAATTLTRYFTLLQTLFLVHTVPAWSSNRGKRLLKSPKMYLNDTGLLCYLLGIEKEAIEVNPHLFGALLETFVFTELQKQCSWSLPQPRLFHYRSVSGQEVDIVLELPNGHIVGIEIKSSQKVTSEDFKGLRSLEDDVGDKFQYGLVLYTGDRITPFGKNLFAVPLADAL